MGEPAGSRLLEHADPRGAVIVLLSADAGQRAAEMLDARWTDVNTAGGIIRVRNGKGCKRRTVEASPDLLKALRAWKPHADGERVMPFTTTAAGRYRLGKLCQAAGIEYLGLHSLRHSCWAWLYRQTGDLNVPRTQLGHADISTTNVYAWMDRGTLKEAVCRRRRLLEASPA